MRKIFVLLAAAVAMASCGAKCEIVGRVDNFNNDGTVYLVDMWSARTVIDSTKMVNNTFHFKNVEHAPTFAQVIMAEGRPISYLFVDEGKVLVAGDYNLGTIKSSGTPSNDAFSAMMAQSQDLMARYRQAVGAQNSAEVAAVEEEHDKMQAEFYENNKENVFGLFMLHQQSYSLTSKELLEKLATLPEHLKTLPVALRMKESAERKFKTEPQSEGSDYVPYYIDIDQLNLKGENVSLKSVIENKKNRYVLLDFWASWCGPCMAEMPYLREAYKLYHKKGFEIYGVSFDSNGESWKGAVEKQQMRWVNVSTLESFNNPAAEEYAVESIPTNYLIDCSNGVIIAKNLRGEAVLEKLAELLK